VRVDGEGYPTREKSMKDEKSEQGNPRRGLLKRVVAISGSLLN
jgi:hypothetical protein